MRTKEEFNQFFQTGLTGVIKTLDKARRKVLFRLFLTHFLNLILILVFLVFFVVWMEKLDEGELESGSFVIIVIGIVFLALIGLLIYLYYRKRKKYVVEFKTNLINPIIKFIDQGLNYVPDGYISSGAFSASKIFHQPYNRYSGDDLVEGTLDKTKILFSELHVANIVHRDKRTEKHPVFDGMFFIADFNKHFKGQTFVLPDKAEKLFKGLGKFFQSMNWNYGQLVKMENIEFEKEFVVYSNDQIEARYIISLSMMERMLALKKRFNRPVYFSFINSNVNFAVALRGKQLEPTVLRSLDNRKIIDSYFGLLNDMIAIVDELNLNTRIWTKQ